MMFYEACDMLNKGTRVRRKKWEKGLYLWLDDDGRLRWNSAKNYEYFDRHNEMPGFSDIIINDWEIYPFSNNVNQSSGNADQTIKSDAGKPRLSLVPTEIISCIARVREYGVKKYPSVDSWKQVSTERYHDALFRHVIAYINDPESVDEESGLPHLWHIATNCAFLCELEKNDDHK